ncbi:uncharacterized serine-rich protein C215.13-like [Haliotis rubra]|uniref:uncharacterized serine-rich protein C215.13-like n=1 Tax=Haliotis rubra TaxID=36100 RepID=UPI001EE54A1B|nr:uncharacterized serine-rich protein C215.13-like [Haliotis rubra]
MSSSIVTDTYTESSSALEGTPSVASYSDGQTIDNSMQASVGASMSALDGVSSVNSMDSSSSALASMPDLNLLSSTSLEESVHASMAPSTVQTGMVTTSETIGVAVSSMDGSMVTMATGHTQTSMLEPSASISTAYNSMDGSMITMANGNSQASMADASNTLSSSMDVSMDGSMATQASVVDASNTLSSSMDGSMATQTGLVDATVSTPFNSQDVSMTSMVTGDGQTSMVGGGMSSTTSVDTQTSMIDPSSTLATALNGMDGSATTTPGAASPGESGTTRLTTSVSTATSLEGGSVVTSMMGSSTMDLLMLPPLQIPCLPVQPTASTVPSHLWHQTAV